MSRLRNVLILECGEPLVDYLALCPRLLVARPRWRYTRLTLARETVARALVQASERLPAGIRLAVVEGWRPPHIQRRMHLAALARWRERHPDWSETQVKRVANRFTAPPHPKVPPPHTTGGAVDVLLVDESGQELDMISPFAYRDSRAYPTHAHGLSPIAQRNRAILFEAMSSTGLTNYPSEYWHWSYGDQGWAYRGQHPHAIFGPIQPPDWLPDPQEAIEAPLEWVNE